ncbi:ATP-binding cassette domain-containing protein [Pyrobaculum aerophilum]|uniref:ATP-binding cassette domain-containing protein n=1 Tax=Pyrobaculum aerophilum TaxID=13773 RepID=UPI0026C23E2D|nr:ATP-binding cassette domain-containing protein [Pyrobaculum aerophilum]
MTKKWLKREKEVEERAFSILRYLRLDHLWDRWASELSGGQMKLLEIGRAIIAGGKLIIMDEPLAGVHPKLAHEILATLKSLMSRIDVTFLLIEHRLDIALGYADYVYAMSFGKVIAEGDPQSVVSSPLVIESYLGKPIKLGAQA